MADLKSIEKFEQAKAEFNDKIAGIEKSAAEMDAAISKMEIEQAESMTAGDIAQAVLFATKITSKKADVVTVRTSLDKVIDNKAKSFANVLEDVRLEAEAVRQDGIKKYAAQEAKVAKARDAFLSELKSLGEIRATVAKAFDQYKTAAQEVESMKPIGERTDLHYKLRLQFDQEPLFRLKLYSKPDFKDSWDGVLGITQDVQEHAYNGGK